jgi:hypothetical protein
MCDCALSWDAAVFRAAAKIARCQPDTVFAVFSALDADGDRAGRLRSEILVAGLGRRAFVIERVLGALTTLGVVVDGLIASEWRANPSPSAVTVTGDARDAVTVTVTSGDVSATSGDPSAIEQRRAVSRRSSAKYRAKLRDACPIGEAYPPDYQQSAGDAPQEEKEEDDHLLSQKDAQAREAQPVEFIRKERWATGVMRRAGDMLSQDEAARLWSDVMLMRPDRSLKNWGLPRRANDRLDRLDNLLTDHDAPKLPLGGAQLIGVGGGRGPPVTAGVTEEERLRRYHHQRMTG